jgi:hypothetical protein
MAKIPASVNSAFEAYCQRHDLRPVRRFSSFSSKAIGEAMIRQHKGKYIIETCIHSTTFAYKDADGVSFGFAYPLGFTGLCEDEFVYKLSK